jgi:multisubunit Na+/H+ antiporter MnhG subunit
MGDQLGDGLAPSSPAVTDATPSESLHAQSVTVPGRALYVKWWKFVLILLAVWVPAGAIGAGLFYWWSHDNTKHKTVVVFVVLVYVVVCTVAGLMLAMVPDRALVSALAIAILSAVYAAVLGAAPAYGAFYCEHSQHRCLMRVLPY